MMKIIKSLVVISAVAVVVIGGTVAYFSDEEKSIGNIFTTGTIDIAVDGNNPWESSGSYALVDMKPSQTDYIDFTVRNVGTNPVNLYKTLKNLEGSDVITSEPECLAEGGNWNGSCSDNTPVYNLQAKINYDLRVELYDVSNKKVWWETIYMDGDNVKLNQLGQMYLGMIPVNYSMKVFQSYHMPATVGNKYQGDKLTFDIVLDAEQLGAHALRLENKEEVDGDLSHTLLADNKYVDLSYKVKDGTFDYTLTPNGIANGEYTLISYKDPWPGNGSVVLGHITVSGNTPVDKSINLEQDLINAKIWLVPGTFGTEGDTISTVGPYWNPSATYFETGLMDYYDADL